ncbi:sugar ABC transporter ATP-binding protein [Christensenellaceae bacterium]|nr:sugar ABC transporter ATP-binding protein [Christensenellaceae bacterium]BDF61904.1 sugar ABC transporter ATP-binding protein [Christensenellaceae bacterium]
MNAIEFKNVHKSYDGKTDIIKGINLLIPSGQRTILLGPSGCGKTTLLRMISGLERISGGELWMGERIVNDVEPGDRNVSMVFQNYALYPHMTVEKNILFGLEIAKVPKEEREQRLIWALDMLGLTPYRTRYPKELSGGQRQRVALCRALVKKAPFFLLDEPLSNLDAQLRTMARAELVKMHKAYSPTFVYVTHDQVEAMTIGQKIVVLHDGIIQQYDSPDVIYNQPKNVFVAKFIGAPSMNVDAAAIEGNELIVGQSRIRVPERWLKRIGNRKKVKFGIRPEHVLLQKEPSDAAARIVYVENHGDKKSIAFQLAERMMMATAEAHFETADNMYMNFDWDKMHFFDVETSDNIGYPES